MSVETETNIDAAAVETEAAPAGDPGGQGWRQDRQGRWFTPAKGRSGVVYRQGNETVAEAHARDSKGPRDKPPKRKPKPPKPPAPTRESLKELEFMLAEGFKAPSMVCAMVGDQWPADHFTTYGPVLARNLVKASETNPWLRAKLEAAVHGEDFMVKVITMLGVGGALAMYAIPPLLYYMPRLAPQEARDMFQIPDRGELRARAAAEQRAEELRAQAAQAEAEAAPGPVAAAA